jgi:hypothetical protein
MKVKVDQPLNAKKQSQSVRFHHLLLSSQKIRSELLRRRPEKIESLSALPIFAVKSLLCQLAIVALPVDLFEIM